MTTFRQQCVDIFIKDGNDNNGYVKITTQEVSDQVGCNPQTAYAARVEVCKEGPGQGKYRGFKYKLRDEYININKPHLRLVDLDAAEESSLSDQPSTNSDLSIHSSPNSKSALKCLAGFIELLHEGRATEIAIIDNIVSNLDPELILSRLMTASQITRKAI